MLLDSEEPEEAEGCEDADEDEDEAATGDSAQADASGPVGSGSDGSNAASERAPADGTNEVADALVGNMLKPGKRRRELLRIVRSDALTTDNIKHVEIIVRALVDEWRPAMRKAVANEPRMQKHTIGCRRKLEKLAVRKFKLDISAKRKNQVSLLNAASKLAISGCSASAYFAIRKILNDAGVGYAMPAWRDLTAARSHLATLQAEDLNMQATADGWFISPRAAIEMEILRLMQVVNDNGSRQESGGRSTGVKPGFHGWQDHFDVKITLDARRITKKTSQTEVMLLIIPKGQDGVERCQKAVYIRTIGVWAGKDSTENVQANMKDFFAEIRSLEKDGVMFSERHDSLLGIYNQFKAMSAEQLAEERVHKVSLTFWFAADMAAQCAVLGQGCAGHHYCGHCMAHRDDRHIPYTLHRVPNDINFQALAHEFDMFPKTLHAINAATDHEGVQLLNEDGFRACTAVSKEAAVTPASVPELAPRIGNGPASKRQPAQTSGIGELRSDRRPAKTRRVDANAQRAATARVRGPDVGVLSQLVGWKQNHGCECRCASCLIPANTVVRVIPRPGFSRPSVFLEEHWPSHKPARFPFCALHCLMRVTEALFQNICDAVLAQKSLPFVERLNNGLELVGIGKKLRKAKTSGDTDHWEKVTFEGHQAMRLLRVDKDGVMGVEKILQSLWPAGHSQDCASCDCRSARCGMGRDYVKRSVVLWKQWSQVVQIMTERRPEVLRANGGFDRFGPECREFIFRYQAMFHEAHCRSFYLHTLLHHAGDFMRELEGQDMCLGMVSNSGAERRHEYGRRAARKALAGGCWRHKIEGLSHKQNVLSYLTLKEILLWQYGTDLVSHELARNAASPDTITGTGTAGQARGGQVNFTVSARTELVNGMKELFTSEPLLTPAELEIEFTEDCVLSEEPRLFESNSGPWKAIEGETFRALIEVPFVSTECSAAGSTVRPDYVREGRDGVLAVDIEADRELFAGRDDHWDIISQLSAPGSDDGDFDLSAFDFPEDDPEDADFDPSSVRSGEGEGSDSESESETGGSIQPRAKRPRRGASTCTTSAGDLNIYVPPGSESCPYKCTHVPSQRKHRLV
jgi:hypothetical protein